MLKPVILLIFANDRSEFLEGIPEELTTIGNIFEPFNYAFETVTLPFISPEELLDDLRKYRKRTVVLHFAGHSNSDVWQTHKGKVYIKGIANFIKGSHSIKLLFLNGCNNKDQVKTFFDVDVPNIIATSRPIADEQAKTFAPNFYKSLVSQNTSIRRAYEDAKASLEVVLENTEEEKRREIDVANLDSWSADKFVWGLYAKDGGDTLTLDYIIKDPLLGVPPLPKRDLPASPFRYLSYFEEKHAELFFGRNRYIGNFYRSITDEDISPIHLLYGQSGVGKSSFLAAGILPRLKTGENQVCYIRRNHTKGILQTIYDELKVQNSFKHKWHELEKINNKPLIIIIDQLEEIFTNPLTNHQVSVNTAQNTQFAIKELKEFTQDLEDIFSKAEKRPRGKLILSFRKEWLSDIENALEEQDLPRKKHLLKPLDREEVIEVITGVSKVPRLQKQYQLSFIASENLPTIIADDLLADVGAALAPTLQILLTKMWREALAENEEEPQFTKKLYDSLRVKGYLLSDFLDQQIAEVRKWRSDVVDSGLLIDILYHHTTPEGTKKEHSFEELKHTYNHVKGDFTELIRKLVNLYLLTGFPKSNNTKVQIRLVHDTLSLLVQKLFYESRLPGQRAKRILESHIFSRESENDSFLSGSDLKIVKAGKHGMRQWTKFEKELVAQSEHRVQTIEFIRELVGSGIGLGLLFVVFRLITLNLAFLNTSAALNYLLVGMLLGVSITLGKGVIFLKEKIPFVESQVIKSQILGGAFGFTLATIVLSHVNKQFFVLHIPIYFLIGLGFAAIIFIDHQRIYVRDIIVLLIAIFCAGIQWWLLSGQVFEGKGLVFAWNKVFFNNRPSLSPLLISLIDTFLVTLVIFIGISLGKKVAKKI